MTHFASIAVESDRIKSVNLSDENQNDLQPIALITIILLFAGANSLTSYSYELKEIIEKIRSEKNHKKKIIHISGRLTFQDLLEVAKRTLTTEQKLCLLLKLYDISKYTQSKSQHATYIYEKFLNAFNSSGQNFEKQLSVISIKHKIWEDAM